MSESFRYYLSLQTDAKCLLQLMSCVKIYKKIILIVKLSKTEYEDLYLRVILQHFVCIIEHVPSSLTDKVGKTKFSSNKLKDKIWQHHLI